MVQLRSCYFCGGVGDSLREYEVVPDHLGSSESGRSAVLCSTCHEKLRRVLEPLAEAAESPQAPDPEPASLQEVTFEAGPVASDDAASPADEGSANAEGMAEDDSTTEGNPPTDEAPPTAAEAPEAGTTATADDDPSEDADATESPDTNAEEAVPEEYYTVLRLLQNREFPMERDDLTGLVTGAYDVSEPQCERILETAIDRGVLVEKGSTLDIGRN